MSANSFGGTINCECIISIKITHIVSYFKFSVNYKLLHMRLSHQTFRYVSTLNEKQNFVTNIQTIWFYHFLLSYLRKMFVQMLEKSNAFGSDNE